jgi:transcriptional regulator of acetoin/glycerol metabolism
MVGIPVEVTDEAVALAVAAPWPGQIRQLRAMVVALTQTALATLAGGTLEGKRIVLRRVDLERHLQERDEAFGTRSFPPASVAPLTMPPEMAGEGLKVKADARALTREQVLAALKVASNNQSEAARNLGIARNTLARRMREFGIDAEE